ncbi:YcaO-like family protein [Lentzea sp. HUAS12]|uniref:YcaO-like family protein n=1 Tax=Lentzea sp. HUAS12 TaxID=2951806 RepID=UPI00209DE8C8|nr:YcaO-like family protein [Lentzea sp. HUAS12]USX56353.1 YcaO-like family protein [Lentzea sp. HUAS12]
MTAVFDGGSVIICAGQGVAGSCARCAVRRRKALHSGRRDVGDQTAHTAAEDRLVAAVLSAVLERGLPDDTLVRQVRPAVPAVTDHRLIRDPGCEVCGEDGEPSYDPVPRTPRPVLQGRFRLTDLRGAGAVPLLRCSDEEFGVTSNLVRHHPTTFPSVSASVPLGLDGAADRGYGRALDSCDAEVVAVAEALERRAARHHRDAAAVASSAQLGDRAFDVSSLGLPVGPQGFPYQRLTPDVELAWVTAWSAGQDRLVLVPRSVAYYQSWATGADQPVLQETSSGCAVGSCLEEAVLHALVEVVERDAVITAWYARTPLPEVDLTTVTDPELRVLITRMRTRSGYDLRAFWATRDIAVPVFWVVATAPPGQPDLPAIVCASGAAPCPAGALRGGLLELAAALDHRRASWPGDPEQRHRAARMLQDPGLVQDITDHGLLYCHPDTVPRWNFLLGHGAMRPWREFAKSRRPSRGDLLLDCRALVQETLARCADVLVVDQTTVEHTTAELRCVKVLVPGAVPITFGHNARRVLGIPRLDAALTASARALTSHPHPFQ